MHRMYSRKIVDETFRLKARGLTDKQIAAQTGVSVQAIRHWRYGTRRNPASTKANWHDYCPRCSTAMIHEEAYAYLLGAYLGDGHITESKPKPGLFALSIFYDNKYPQLIAYCLAAMGAVFPVKPFPVQRQGCTEIKAYSKHWTCIFPQHGPGKKHERLIALEPWQQSIVDAHPEALARGFIHSDGCRTINRIRKANGEGFYEYPRYHFSNVSTDIVGLFTDALDRLGIPWKRHLKRPEAHKDQDTVSISRQEAVARMDSFIGAKC